VGIDNKTLNALKMRWPFPRSYDARAIDILHAAGARTIVYDVQFSQPTVPAQDLALYEAVGRAGNVVLATTEIGAHGETNVLGGNANLASAHARAAAANFRANSADVLQQYPYSVGGLRSLAVTAAEQASGQVVPRSSFHHNSAWIDYPGPAGTISTVSFSDLLEGHVSRRLIAGKIVVIGATSPVLQDLHRTSVTTNSEMSGPEVQADAIWTALRGNPLSDSPRWLALLTIVLAAIATPLSCLTIRPGRALLMGLLFAAAYALLAQVAFNRDLIISFTYPMAALAGGTLGALLVSYLSESWERQLADRYGAALEDTVRARTAELLDTQLEVIHRLARAAELRDEDTGLHIERVGRICERVALAIGMSPADAERLRVASTLHDVGKIGVPDSVLRKRGELTGAEWEQMKAHTTTGAALLAGSRSSLLQMAELIARTHHERWDGSGYPFGLRGEEIPLVGRICAICDVFDALSSEREYKHAWPRERVIAELEGKRGTHFDPALVDVFLTVIEGLELEQPSSPARAPELPVLARRGAGDVSAHST
jgi:CHASE2 domain-containing sensor protein